MIHNVNQVNIIRDLNREDVTDVSSDFLVPGHIIEIKNKTVMQCDALLLEDSNAIMNESMLTGESIKYNWRNRVLVIAFSPPFLVFFVIGTDQ